MKTVLTLIFTLSLSLLYGQTNEQLKTEKWLFKNNIQLMEIDNPKEFDKFYDCESRPAFIKHTGDTILLYSWNGSVAQTLDEFKKTVKQKDVDPYYYPSEVQSNGTVVVNNLNLSVFLWRNDTLYLFDDYNADLGEAQMDIMFKLEPFNEKVYEAEINKIDLSKYPFTPSFKTIYFKDIFKSSETYAFTMDQNFKLESVRLIGVFVENNIEYTEIKLNTRNDGGTFRFSSDLKQIERTNCKRN